MALKERTVVLTGVDADGNTTIDMPITTVENVEGAILTVINKSPDSSGNVDLGLATVATSGSYNDLTNKPSIDSVPIASVIAFAANSAPSGYLLCNGAAVSRTTYASLYAAIGTTYGEGDGSTTFNLPNLVDLFIQGSGTAGTVKSAGLPNLTALIQHGTTDGFKNSSNGMLSVGEYQDFYWINGSGGIGRRTENWSFNASTQSSIYGNSSTVQPPALTMRYYIKY